MKEASKRKLFVDLIIATTLLVVSYYLPESIWPFIPTVLGGAGLVFAIIFAVDLIKAAKAGWLEIKGDK